MIACRKLCLETSGALACSTDEHHRALGSFSTDARLYVQARRFWEARGGSASRAPVILGP